MIQHKEKSQPPVLFTPVYPTKLYQDTAELVGNYFDTKGEKQLRIVGITVDFEQNIAPFRKDMS